MQKQKEKSKILLRRRLFLVHWAQEESEMERQ